MIAFTDYPILALGDEPGKPAPIRLCHVRPYDGNKYCRVTVHGVNLEIKSGYLYQRPGRCGKVPHLTAKQLRALVPDPWRAAYKADAWTGTGPVPTLADILQGSK